MAQKKILIVEDDEVLRTVLLEKLSQSGYTVDGAEDGVIALEKLRGGAAPDIILLDILMPRKNGMEVMEELSVDPVLSKIPIMVISNSGQPVEIERANKLGAKDFLIKAVFDPSEVLQKVQTLLNEATDENKTVSPPPVSATETAEAAEPQKQTPPSDAPSNEKSIDLDAAVVDHETQKQDVANAKKEGWGALVVEDDKFLRELFVRKLISSGLKVEGAIDAKTAFEILERWQPNIILLDLILPDIDGFEILSRLKKDDRFKDIPVIVLSNLGQQEDMDRAMNLGAIDFMIKASFNLEEIVERVQKAIAEHSKAG